MSTAERSKFIYLRPGANIFKQSAGNLQIAFPNYTVTFETPEIVLVISEILKVLEAEHVVEKVTEKVIKNKDIDKDFATYLLKQLVSNNCAFFSDEEWKEEEGTELDKFYKYIFDKPQPGEQLNHAGLLLLVPEDKEAICKTVFEACGMKPVIIPAAKGSSLKAYREQIMETRVAVELVACWNFPYRQPVANMINSLCVEKKWPVLFGGCEGISARIGPFIIPHNSSCLECMHMRLYGNFDDNEIRSYSQFRVIENNSIYNSWISHPVFHSAILHLFSTEINRILIGLQSNCTGSYYEYSFGEISSRKYPVIKVPNCPVCCNGRPTRFAWDFKFPAPVVKNTV